MPTPLSFFEIKVPKSSEVSPEAMATCLTALPKISNSILKKILGNQSALSFEIIVWNQQIHFITAIPSSVATYFNSQLTAQYSRALIEPVSDYMPFLFIRNTTLDQKFKISHFAKLTLANAFYLPIKTYKEFTDIDPLSTILGALAKANPQDKIVIQYLVSYASKSWQNRGYQKANQTIPTSEPGKVINNPQKSIIEAKIAQTGLNVEINLLAVSNNRSQAEIALQNIAGSFASVSHPEGNHFTLQPPNIFNKKKLLNSIFTRQPNNIFSRNILTSQELATIFHLPNKNLSSIKNIVWGGTLSGEPPENLPIATNLTEEEKQQTNFIARTEFKNKITVYGIKKSDRRKHIYIIGKTGVGKSTLIANMAINDMRNNEGLAIIDPHGDLCETILDYVPKHRINDVVYLDPTNSQMPFRLNPLEVDEPEQADLVASGIVAIFHKLFAYSWGPRLEYILRNTILTLCQAGSTTLLDVPRILTSRSYRDQILAKINDPTLQKFWDNEFNALDDRARTEAISPILNKVGQFIISPKIRLILERPHSSINLSNIMDTGKILILNLSQGKIGEDNAALLGAMFITKIQLAAMNRVNIPEWQRRDFYLYVDEFQNFATSSFIKILSEARKYRLNLTVANQYTAQVEEDVQKAIFGNVGSIISFLVGAQDAHILNEEFGQIYEENDLVHLNNFEIINKISIDNRTSSPFPAITLPLPKNTNQNRDKVIKLSSERYGKPNKSQTPSSQISFSSHHKEVHPEYSLGERPHLNTSNIPNNNKSQRLHPKNNNTPSSQSSKPNQPLKFNPNPHQKNSDQNQQAQKAIDKLTQADILKTDKFKSSPVSSPKPSLNRSQNRPVFKVEIEK